MSTAKRFQNSYTTSHLFIFVFRFVLSGFWFLVGEFPLPKKNSTITSISSWHEPHIPLHTRGVRTVRCALLRELQLRTTRTTNYELRTTNANSHGQLTRTREPHMARTTSVSSHPRTTRRARRFDAQITNKDVLSFGDWQLRAKKAKLSPGAAQPQCALCLFPLFPC